MERLHSFDDSYELSSEARCISCVAELWDKTSDEFHRRHFDDFKNLGDFPERDRIVIANFVNPVLECLKQGRTEDEIECVPHEYLAYFTVWHGSATDFNKFAKDAELSSVYDTRVAMSMVEKGLYGLSFRLDGLAGAERYYTGFPSWVKTDEEKEKFVRTVYVGENPPNWYLMGTRCIEKDCFDTVREFKGDKLLAACFSVLWQSDWEFSLEDSGAIFWVSVQVGNERSIVPIYRVFDVMDLLKWYSRECIAYLSKKSAEDYCYYDTNTPWKFKIKDGTAFVYDTLNRNPDLTPGKIYSDFVHPDPIESLCAQSRKTLGYKEFKGSIDSYKLEYKAIEGVLNGFNDWVVFLKSHDVFRSLDGRIVGLPCLKKSLADLICERCKKEYCEYEPGFVMIGNELKSVYVAFLDGSLQQCIDRGEVIGINAKTFEKISVPQHLRCIDDWMHKTTRGR